MVKLISKRSKKIARMVGRIVATKNLPKEGRCNGRSSLTFSRMEDDEKDVGGEMRERSWVRDKLDRSLGEVDMDESETSETFALES